MAILYQFRTKNFTLRYEDTDETDFDLSWDETGEARQKLDSGEWQMFCAKVSILYRGVELAAEYLGGCIYADPKQFIDHRGAQGRYGSYFRDMVSQAIGEVRDMFTDMPLLRKVPDTPLTNVEIDRRMNLLLAKHNAIPPAGWDFVEGGAYSSDDRRRSLEQ